MRRFLSFRYLATAIVLLLVIGLVVVPNIGANRYRASATAALEHALGRKVEIGQIHFRLLPIPGLTLSNVIVGEDPAVGVEPVAYITTLKARPRITALLAGRLAFSSVVLEETSINLTRVDRGTEGVKWNYTSLVDPNASTSFPVVHMSGGRVNFKFGETKSVFYLLDTDVDLWPPDRAAGPWTIRVNAQPARTDRPARGFGSFVARGEWRPADRALTIDVKLEKSEMSDMLTLFHGSEVGLLGNIWGDAHLAGPIDRVGISGHVNVSNLHGWNETPPGGRALPFALGGVIDARQQAVDLRARVDIKDSPVDIRYRVSEFLGRPRWGVTVMATRLPLNGALDVARNLGYPIPSDFHLDGSADGAVGFAMPDSKPQTEGEIRLSDLVMTGNQTPALKLSGASMHFAGSQVSIDSAALTTDTNDAATLSGHYDLESQTLHVDLATNGMAVAALRRQVAVAGTPLLSLATKGSWNGAVRFDSAKGWTGEVQLKNVDVPFEAFAEPVHLTAAAATIDGNNIAIRRVDATLGSIAAQGDYKYDAQADRPHQFHLSLATADLAAIEKLLMPALRRGNILTDALSLGRPAEPDWLKAVRADGTIQAATLDLNGIPINHLRAHVLWDGSQVAIEAMSAQVAGSPFTGSANIDLAARQPKYKIDGKLGAFPWRGGALDGEGVINTSGTGTALLSNLHGEGKLRAHNLNLAPLDSIAKGEGAFDLNWSGRGPVLKLNDLVVTSGGSEWTGSAEMPDTGVLALKLSDGSKQVSVSGAVLKGEALKIVSP